MSVTTPTSTPQQTIANDAWKKGFAGALNALALVLAIRMFVGIAVIGGIVLTWLALETADPLRLGALAIYCLGVMIPIVFLASRS